ncbi:hypothetical protein AAVH_14292 [Aphelenchoides avenae]|nr:hypothetical protein AAVH_14292 [Aphelenchus avenae]
MSNEKHMAQLRDKAADFALYIQFIQSFEAYRVLSVDDKLTQCISAETGRNKEDGFETSKTGPEKCLSADKSFRDLVHETFGSSLATIVAAMDRMQMTDVEFLGVSLMILFDPQRDGLSEIARKLLCDARNQLSTDWLDLYTKCGIHNGEERMGNSVLLLPAIYVSG